MSTVKTSQEIKYLRQAQKIADTAFADLLPTIKTGITELELAAKLDKLMAEHGSEAVSFATIVGFGGKAIEIHHEANDTKLKTGDFILFDFGAVYKGYHSDMSRTIVCGKANEVQRRQYNTVLRAHLAAASQVKAGVSCAYLHRIATDVIDAAHYKGKFTHGLGHGVGREVHEAPSLSRKSGDILQAGNVITIEPGIYVKYVGGVRIEDMGLVTESGFDSFATTTKELLEI